MNKNIVLYALLIGAFFTLLGCNNNDIKTPTVKTAEVKNISERTAVAGGFVSTDNGNTISAHGVCWSTDPNPTIENNKLEAKGEAKGYFICTLSGLNPLTTYYVKAYVTYSGGIAYGEQVNFTTNAFELTTNPPSFITDTTAISGGTVSFDIDSPDATSRGVCWNTSSNPTTSDSKTLDGVGKGSFVSYLTGLNLLQYIICVLI